MAESALLGPELPPTLVFELDWASPAERNEILERMVAEQRQTMNLRVMPKARLLRIRACDDGNRLVGWAGFDVDFTPDIAELFSLFVVQEYRNYSVGSVLEIARAEYIRRRGKLRAFLRMETATNGSLLGYRVRNRLMIEVKPGEIPRETLGLCRRCELHGGKCTSQAYFWFDLDLLRERGRQRLGFSIDVDALPQRIALDPGRFRKAERPLDAEGPILKRDS